MILDRNWAVIACFALAFAALLATGLPAGHAMEASPVKPLSPAPPARGDANTVRFAAGAPQLAMIRSTAVASSPMPVAEPLSARVAYDEDVTARIGVGISGRVVDVKAAAGDAVRPGQVLAEIDSPDFGAARADLDKARADEVRKRLTLARARDLGPGEGIAAKDLEGAEADYAAARAETARAEQRLASLNPHGLPVHGQRIGLASPLPGTVTERTATPALEVTPGATPPLFVVSDLRRLWLLIDVPERLLPRMRLGSRVSVESEAWPGQRFTARIVQLGQVIDPNTRRAVARARLDNGAGKLLPEMFVSAAVLQDSGTGVRLPNAAIVNRGLYAFVFVETAAGTFERRQVKLLARGSEFSFTGEGLRDGERVVTNGALLLDAELAAPDGRS